jgi:hypothetical protein
LILKFKEIRNLRYGRRGPENFGINDMKLRFVTYMLLVWDVGGFVASVVVEG